jgi:hypothetical protein
MEKRHSVYRYCVGDVTVACPSAVTGSDHPNKGLAVQLVRRDAAQVMSEENVELVRQALNALIEVDEGLAEIDRLYEFIAPDAIWDLGDLLEVAGQGKAEIRGMDEFYEWPAGWIEAYDDWGYSAEKVVDAGANRVVVTFSSTRQTARQRLVGGDGLRHRLCGGGWVDHAGEGGRNCRGSLGSSRAAGIVENYSFGREASLCMESST